MGEGEEAASAQGAAQPTAHQTHPHLLSVSGADGASGAPDATLLPRPQTALLFLSPQDSASEIRSGLQRSV